MGAPPDRPAIVLGPATEELTPTGGLETDPVRPDTLGEDDTDERGLKLGVEVLGVKLGAADDRPTEGDERTLAEEGPENRGEALNDRVGVGVDRVEL